MKASKILQPGVHTADKKPVRLGSGHGTSAIDDVTKQKTETCMFIPRAVNSL